jgi:hypothetical protein
VEQFTKVLLGNCPTCIVHRRVDSRGEMLLIADTIEGLKEILAYLDPGQCVKGEYPQRIDEIRAVVKGLTSNRRRKASISIDSCQFVSLRRYPCECPG